MDFPKICDRVRVEGEHSRVYFVIKVDEEQQTVDLVSVSGPTRMLDGVPFSKILKPSGAGDD